jgi:broad specificity phosphatase PhoE
VSGSTGGTGGPPRRLWLVRHGDTEGQSNVRFHGSNDIALAEIGRAQVRALAPLLAGLQPAAIVHSPLVRAAESAAILADACGHSRSLLRADPRLREISFGDCEGLTADEIAARFPAFWAEHQRGAAAGFPGGEPRREFAARVAAAVRELAAWPGEDVLVVSHRGTVRHALRTLLGIADGQRDQLGVRLGSLTVVRRAAQWEMARWEVELFDFVGEPGLG